jgi:DNA-binding CsgD family transcriptional regulator/PAS domain-containing protein
MGLINDETATSIIGDIYDCALDPSGWSNVLARITRSMNGAYTGLSLSGMKKNSNPRLIAYSPWDPVMLRKLHEDYSLEEICPVDVLLAGDVGVPQTMSENLTEEERNATRFFRDWAQPQNLLDACILKFAHTADQVGFFVCATRYGRSVITKDEQRFMAQLSPHLRRASLIGDMLDHAAVATSLYQGALDNLSVPVFLTGADGSILYSNASAEKLLIENTTISAKNGIIQTSNLSATQALMQAIEIGASADTLLGPRGIGIPLSGKNEPPTVAYVLPLTKGTARAALRPACTAVFIATTTSAHPLPESILSTMFDLTPAESRIFMAVGLGKTSSEIATSFTITESTVKTHLTRIYSKTNTSRQLDLVKLGTSIGAPFSMT